MNLQSTHNELKTHDTINMDAAMIQLRDICKYVLLDWNDGIFYAGNIEKERLEKYEYNKK